MTRKWRRASDTPSWSWSTRCKRGTETGRAGNAAGRRSPSKAPVTPVPPRWDPALLLRSSLISWGWQPHKLILVCSQVCSQGPDPTSAETRGERGPCFWGVKAHLGSVLSKTTCFSHQDVQHHKAPEMLSSILIRTYLMLPKTLQSFLMQNLSVNDCRIFNIYVFF